MSSRDSFLLYKAFWKPISKLSDKQLGRLFRAIYQYQIDGGATVEEDIEMAFEFFKNQFEIDEEKYQSTVERNRRNGRKRVATGQPGDESLAACRASGNTDPEKGEEENEVEDGDGDNEPGLSDPPRRSQREPNNPTGAKQPSGCQKTQWVPKNPVASKQPSGSHNDNDNDNDNDLIDVGRTRGMPRVEFLNSTLKGASYESLLMKQKISDEEFRAAAEETVLEWQLTGQKHESLQDARKHLLSQIRVKINSKNPTDGKQKTKQGSDNRRGAPPSVWTADSFEEPL